MHEYVHVGHVCVCLGVEIQLKELLEDAKHNARGRTLLYWVWRQPQSEFRLFGSPSGTLAIVTVLIGRDEREKREIADEDHKECGLREFLLETFAPRVFACSKGKAKCFPLHGAPWRA